MKHINLLTFKNFIFILIMNKDDLMDNFLQGDEFDMDLELFEMRKQFNEMKRERMNYQKNSEIMENKIKLLESEELSVKKTLNRQINNKNTMVKKMAELGAAKEEIIKVSSIKSLFFRVKWNNKKRLS
jgi:hypothetical protein